MAAATAGRGNSPAGTRTEDVRNRYSTALAGVRLEQDGFWAEGANESLMGFMCWRPMTKYRERDQRCREAFTMGWNAALKAIAEATGADFTARTVEERTIPDEIAKKAT